MPFNNLFLMYQLSNPARISWTFWPEEYMIRSWPTIPDWVQNMLF
jgi:hypothetical protein